MDKQFSNSKAAVKQARDDLLKLHKVLMDWDRERYERVHGAMSPGKFLEKLMGDPRFEWLRVLSMLIVRIDEAFDLDDGVSMEMLEGFRQEIIDIFDGRSAEYAGFKEKFREGERSLPEAVRLRDQVLSYFESGGEV